MKTLEELGYRKSREDDFFIEYADGTKDGWSTEIHIRKDDKTVTKFMFGAHKDLTFDEVRAIAALLEEKQ